MRRALIALVVATLAGNPARAENPLFNYQGRLLKDDGTPVNEWVTVAVNIYTSSTEGAAAYGEQVGSVLVQNGIYSFSYGTNLTALRGALSGAETWLELLVNGSPLSPRQRLHYTPYAMSLDERSLVQSTEFLLSMVAKHELEIQAIRAQLGMVNTSGGPHYFTESFPDADGFNNLVNLSLTDALYHSTNHTYVGHSTTNLIIEQPGVVSTRTNEVFCTVKTFTNLGAKATWVSDEVSYTNTAWATGTVRFVFTYCDGSSWSNLLHATCTNTDWTPVECNNLYWDRIVSNIEVALKRGSLWTNTEDSPPVQAFSERNTKVCMIVTSSTPATVPAVVFDLPAITGRMTHASLFADIVENKDAAEVDYEITAGSTTITNVPLGQKTPLTGFTNNPTRIRLLLHSCPTNPTLDAAVESVMFKWWYE